MTARAAQARMGMRATLIITVFVSNVQLSSPQPLVSPHLALGLHAPSRSAAGLLSIDEPRAGHTMLAGSNTIVSLSIDALNTSALPCDESSEFSILITASSDLSRIVLAHVSVPTHDLRATRASIVAPRPGIWKIECQLYCSMPQTRPRLERMSVIKELRQELQRSISLSEEGMISGPSLVLAFKQIQAGQLQDALQNLVTARLSILSLWESIGHEPGNNKFFMTVVELIAYVDEELSSLAKVKQLCAVIFVLAAPEGTERWTMEGCSDLLDDTSRHDSEGSGFAEETWVRTRECLVRFCQLFPENEHSRTWLGRVEEVFGWAALDGGALGDEGARRGVQECQWVQERRVAVASSDSSEGGSGDAIEGHDEVYLSIILAAKHDDSVFCQVPQHHCLDRLRAFLATTMHLLAAHGLANSCEIIFVEYNPISLVSSEYLNLSEAVQQLVKPSAADTPTIRILTVTEQQHENIYNPFGFDFLEFHAKNVAARRARGKFLLFTNPDDIWAEGLARLIGRRQLKPDVFYVTHRGSISDHVPVMKHVPASRMIEFAQEHGQQPFTTPHMTHSVGLKWNTSACDEGEEDDDPMGFSRAAHGFFLDNAPGDFFLASRRAVLRMRGHAEIPHIKNSDGLLLYIAAAHGLRQLVMKPKCSIYHQNHARSPRSHVESFSYSHSVQVSADLLAAGAAANQRPAWMGSASQAIDESFYEQLEYHKWNGPDWGLASEAVAETLLTPKCYHHQRPMSAGSVQADGAGVAASKTSPYHSAPGEEWSAKDEHGQAAAVGLHPDEALVGIKLLRRGPSVLRIVVVGLVVGAQYRLTVEFANSEHSVEEHIYLTDKHLTHSDHGGSVSAYVERNLNPASLHPLQTDLVRVQVYDAHGSANALLGLKDAAVTAIVEA